MNPLINLSLVPRILKIIFILMKLNIREPLSFIYNLAMPLVAFAGIIFWQRESTSEFRATLDSINTISSYIIFSSAIYGVGMLFCWWREQGLFLTYCNDEHSIRLLVISQITIRTAASMGYVFTVLISAFSYFNEWDLTLIFNTCLAALLLGFTNGFFALLILKSKFAPSDTNAIINGIVFSSVLFHSLQSHSKLNYAWLNLINFANPVSINSHLIELLGSPSASFSDLGLPLSTCTALACFGIVASLKFDKHPKLTRL